MNVVVSCNTCLGYYASNNGFLNYTYESGSEFTHMRVLRLLSNAQACILFSVN